jgi:thiol-disulfide isomerase/thioredoxin
MKPTLLRPIVVMTGLLLAPAALAQQAGKEAEPAAQPAKKHVLVMGDKAPPIAVETFVKGEPIKAFENGKVYVVEFWATWCGPCIRAFPHLSKLQKEYKDKGLTVIGVNIWEEGDPAEYSAATLEKVRKFVETQGDKMAYTVAFDGGAAKMNQTYMQAAGQDGIPASFIVNQEGKIAWIGNPHDPQFDSILASVIDKTHNLDPEKVAKARADAEKRDAGQALMRELSTKLRADDADGALAVADKLVELGGTYAEQAASWKFNYLLVRKQDTKAAVAFGKSVYDSTAKDSPMLLNQLAWTIVDPEGTVADKDTEFALKCAQRAVELTKEKDGAILDTLARVHFVRGDTAKALETQRKAVAVATPDFKGELEKALKEYEEASKK